MEDVGNRFASPLLTNEQPPCLMVSGSPPVCQRPAAQRSDLHRRTDSSDHPRTDSSKKSESPPPTGTTSTVWNYNPFRWPTQLDLAAQAKKGMEDAPRPPTAMGEENFSPGTRSCQKPVKSLPHHHVLSSLGGEDNRFSGGLVGDLDLERQQLVAGLFSGETSETILDAPLAANVFPKLLSRRVAEVIGLICVWWVIAGVIVVQVKILNTQFPFPFFFTGVSNGMAAFFLLVGLWLSKRQVFLPVTNREAQYLVVLGVIGGLDVSIANLALKQLPIATRQMFFATAPLFQMFFAWLWGLPPRINSQIVVCSVVFFPC